MGSRQTATLASLAIAACLALAGAASAQNVGVTGAVNPQATGTPPGSTVRVLGVGNNVVFNENIATTADGQAEILFLDRSSLTVGPNSDLVIDEFVYSPETGTGKLAMSTAKGLFRFVGGALSKNEGAVSIKTPSAIVGIRGGVAMVNIGADLSVRVVFAYGGSTTVTSGGGGVTIGTPGFMTFVPGPGQPPSPPTKVDPALLQQMMAQLNGKQGGTGGASPPPTEQDLAGGPGVFISLDDDLDLNDINLRNYLRPVEQFDIPEIEKLFKGRQPVKAVVINTCGNIC